MPKMEKTKLFPKGAPWEKIILDIPNAIETIYSLPAAKYNSNLFRDLAVGFKSLVYAMEKDHNSQDVYPLFIKWFKLYVRLQHQIESNDPLRSKFESKIPVCTSYVLASLQYQTRIANYHHNIMEMCLLLFKSAQPLTMQNIANLDIELIAQLWNPVGFVGDYITQRLCLKLIVAVLTHLSAEERKKQVSKAKLDQGIEHLILKLSADPTDFEKVSRELLNLYNMTFSKNCTVFSIYCTKALFGSSELFKPDRVTNFWIDFNYTSKCVSLLCQLNQSERKQEEFYIKIKINKLQIENQFDCSVYTIEQASFSTEVSAKLLSSRVAVFTLPQNELERLKANSDLIDFYNTFSYSQSSEVSTPNTIQKYLADLSIDSPMTPYSEKSCDFKKMKSARVKLHKCDDVERDCQSDSTKTPNTKLTLENNPTANSTSLVSHVEYLPNYVGPSIKKSDNNTSVNTTTIQDAAIFKKPHLPVKYKTHKKAQFMSGKVQKNKNTSGKLPYLKVLNTLKSKNVNKPPSEIINSTYSIKKTNTTSIDNIEQTNSSFMPKYKSEKEHVQSARQKSSRDEISFAFTSIQVSTNSFQRFSNTTIHPVKHQNFQNIKQKLIEENSLLEMSLQEISNTSKSVTNKPNVETITRKSVDNSNFSLSHPQSSENVLPQCSKPSETPANPPNQASVVPIPRPPKMTKSTQLYHCLEVLEDQNSLSHTFCDNRSQEFLKSSYLNRLPIINKNISQCLDNESHVISSQTSNDGSQAVSQNIIPSIGLSKPNPIVENKSSSGTTLQYPNLDSFQQRTNSLENIAPELQKDTSRRFFKYKNLPGTCSTATTKPKPKSRKKKTNATESHPKTKNINLVKPLNYVTDSSSDINKPVSETKENEISEQIKNLVNSKDKASFLGQKSNGAVQDFNIIGEATDQRFLPKPIKRRSGKRKILLKEVEVSNFVPYSIWKNNQKEKNNGESIILSPRRKQQKEVTSRTESPRPSKDPFDKVKNLGIKNNSIARNQTNDAQRTRRSSSTSDSIKTFYFSESENEAESGKSPIRNKPRNSFYTEIVRREQPDDIIQSPITVPFEIAETSTSRECVLTQMSLDSDCLEVVNSPQQADESNWLLGNRTMSSVSPVYEDLDDEVPEDPLECDISDPSKVYNSLIAEYHKEVLPPTKDLSDSEEENQELPDNRPSLESRDNNIESEVVPLMPNELQFVGEVLQKAVEERTYSSQGSPISVRTDGETNEQEAHTNEIIIRNHHVMASLRKRTHSAENGESSVAKIAALTHSIPLRDYDRLLPEFVKKLTNEKDRLLNDIKTKFNEDIFDDFTKTVEAVTKTINYHETAIKEEQEKLSSILENLECHQKILQKNQSELEKIHGEVIERIRKRNYKTNKIDEIYKEAEEVLVSYADVVRRDQWHSFSKSIVNFVNERLKGYLEI